jgi:hypothetical protein
MVVSEQLGGLVTELERQQAGKRDVMADTRRIQLVDTRIATLDPTTRVDLAIDNDGGLEEFPVRRYAHQQLATETGVPWKLYERLQNQHPDLLIGLANGLLHREPSKRMIRLLDGEVRAVVSNRYRRLDNYDLMEQAVLPVMAEFPEMEVSKWQLSETRLYIKLTLPHEIEIKVGDVAQAGVIVSNSEVGAGAIMVAPYTNILWCSNGAVHMQFGKRKHHAGRRIEVADEAYDLYSDATLKLDDAAYFAKVADLMRAACNESVFEQIARSMRDLTEISMDGDPVEAVKELSQRHGLTEGEGGLLQKYLLQVGKTNTAWDYHQALTRSAQDADPDRQTELEQLAGDLLLTDANDWALSA